MMDLRTDDCKVRPIRPLRFCGCLRPADATVVVSVPGRPDHASFWCKKHFDALDLEATAAMLTTGGYGEPLGARTVTVAAA